MLFQRKQIYGEGGGESKQLVLLVLDLSIELYTLLDMFQLYGWTENSFYLMWNV